MKWLLRVLPLLLLGCTTPAPETKKVAEKPSDLVVLKGARVWDGTGQEPVEQANLVLKQDKIVSVLPTNAPLPPDALLIDVAGKTIIPALVSAHVHLGLTKDGEAGAQLNTEENVLRQLAIYKAYGVGTVASLGSDQEFIFKLRDRRKTGEIAGPYILTAGYGFGADKGAPPLAMGMTAVNRPKTIEEAKVQFEALAAKNPDLIKIWVDDLNKSVKNKLNPKVYESIILMAQERGIPVVGHVYYLKDAKSMVKSGINIFGHSIRDKTVDPEFISLMRTHKVGYLPTLTLDEASYIYADQPEWMRSIFFQNALDPKVWDKLQPSQFKPKAKGKAELTQAKKNVLALFKAGVKVGLGTDSGATIYRVPGFMEHRELALLVESGLTPSEALQAGTRVSAEILGISDQRGTLQPGKKADFIILNQNPLTLIGNTETINAVWLEGKPVSQGPADLGQPKPR